ncbi:hypothetical protein BDL97_16G022600 [Sphagnum fallax]|nr:hypothetical protein BDL97_16G022600 [Sphagnum fallax]
MAVATIANLAAVPTASLAYLKAARLESSPQSASSSLRVRSISSQSASSSSSSPRVRASKCNCFERILINPGCHHFSQGAVLRAERAHHHRINASLNEVHVGNQASELVLINASVQQFLDTHAKCTTIEEKGINRNVSVQDFEQLLMEKAQQVKQEIERTCIFLIGMMGSGKSTVGRLMSEALGYKFLDSDNVIESYAGGLSVAEIFQTLKEEGFRKLESQALRELSLTSDLVVATGGGAVVQHQNWTYLRNGITVWLDVPVPALAHRVTAVGTGTRPLLGGDCGGYDQALARLSKIFEERGPAYANADVTVSLQSLALTLACEDVSELTPTAITVQVLEELIQHSRLTKRYFRAPVCY